MKPTLRSRTLTVLVAALAFGACGDGTGITGDLTGAEAASMLAALSTVWFPSPSAPSASPPGPALAPETTLRQDTTEVEVGCLSGGIASIFSVDSTSITVDARIAPSPDTVFASNTVYGGTSTTTTSYLDCQSPDGQGSTWTFAADPGLTFDYTIDGTIDSYQLTGQTAVISTTTNWSGLWAGSFSWSNGSRSGSCTISLTSTSATSNVSGQVSTTFSQQGQICGLDVSSGS